MQQQASIGSDALVSVVSLIANHALFVVLWQTWKPGAELPMVPYLVQVACLIELVQNGAAVAHHLWVLLFPIVWSSLQKEQQVYPSAPACVHQLGMQQLANKGTRAVSLPPADGIGKTYHSAARKRAPHQAGSGAAPHSRPNVVGRHQPEPATTQDSGGDD